MLDIISEEPFMQAFIIGFISKFVFVNLRADLLRLLRNHTKGTPPPTHWLSPVARAAPATPIWNTAIKRKSRTMFVTPAIITTYIANFGFSATIM